MAAPSIEVGTSGWQYDHWRGDFYSEKLPKSRWFEHYASIFSTVELNNSFYRQPKSATWERWQDQAPAQFCYAIKANRFITHIKRFRDGEDPIERFLDGAERLKSHLGPVLFQAPPNFEKTDENLGRLDEFFSLMPRRVRSVLEFRHPSWYDDETYELLRRRQVSFCIHDMTKLETPVVTTGPIAYLRFHGSGARYGGNYSDEMLGDWAKRIRSLSHHVEGVWCYFNNDIGGHAPRNALTLREMLAD
jgi:uncharacterized protein YecE (DUF72 family)